MRINGFEQIKGFYSWVFSNQELNIKPQHISLYLFLVNQNNRNGWAEWFKVPFDLAMAGSCISSKKTYYNCMDDLSEWKLISHVKGANAYKSAVVKLEVLKDTSSVPQSEPQQDFNCTSNDYTTVPHDEPHDEPQGTHYIKPLTSNYKPKTGNYKKGDVADATLVTGLNFSFDEFWILYDKKVGSLEKIKKKWEKLKPDERARAIEYIPKYKIVQSDKKFRKNPETFLNNKSWNDELITSNGTTITNTATSIEQRKADRDGMGELARDVLAKIAAQHSA